MNDWKLWNADAARPFIAIPTPSDDKYSRGVLGVIAGSRQYPGAAILTTSAALRSGIGLIRYVGPRRVNSLVISMNPEIVLGVGRVTAWVAGSGIPTERISSKHRHQILRACRSGLPICLDAGALKYLDHASSPTLITPHHKELQALLSRKGFSVTLEEISDNPKFWASKTASDFGVTVLLKGNVSVVASLDTQIELPSAPSWLATAGTGDVLTGIIGALLATNSELILRHQINLASIAATASLIHSNAAELALTNGPLTSSDVVRKISPAILDIIK